MPGTMHPVGPGGSPLAPKPGSRVDGLAPCTLTYYDPALGGINSSHGQADPHAATASGEPYDARKFTCAAPPEFAFGTNLLIQANGKKCVVKVNDRGGAIQTTAAGPHFDLSVAANKHLGGPSAGMYKRTLIPPGAATTGGDVISSAVNSVTAPFADLAKVFSFLFSKQFLYVLGGGILMVVAIVLIVHSTGTGLTGVASKAIRKVPPIE